MRYPLHRVSPGRVISYIVGQPTEVANLVDAAARCGATVLKPAKKGFFGGFSAVYQAPDGAIWKLAAPTKKDTGAAGDPPLPTEIGMLVGVPDPKALKAFYAALGMTVDRDYGSKYVDFQPVPGACRFGLLPRKALAKDAGIDDDGAGLRESVLERRAESRAEVDSLLATAASEGGEVTVEPGEIGADGYSGQFTDPDGIRWRVASV